MMCNRRCLPESETSLFRKCNLPTHLLFHGGDLLSGALEVLGLLRLPQLKLLQLSVQGRQLSM